MHGTYGFTKQKQNKKKEKEKGRLEGKFLVKQQLPPFIFVKNTWGSPVLITFRIWAYLLSYECQQSQMGRLRKQRLSRDTKTGPQMGLMSEPMPPFNHPAVLPLKLLRWQENSQRKWIKIQVGGGQWHPDRGRDWKREKRKFPVAQVGGIDESSLSARRCLHDRSLLKSDG